MVQLGSRFPQFYLTAPSPCPYLPDQLERKVFTQLSGKSARGLNEALTHAGFRRSQNIAYKPACDGCVACVSVRIVAGEFLPGRWQRRILAANADLTAQPVPNIATAEQFELLRHYLDTRHAGGGMAGMDEEDYVAMVEDSAVPTHVVEYRRPAEGRTRGKLVGAALTDVLADGLSMVYSFFDPAYAPHSLGSYMILDQIARARTSGLDYVYLGYWVKGSRKMGYKARFSPLEALGPEGWVPFPSSASAATADGIAASAPDAASVSAGPSAAAARRPRSKL
jgi:arginine-tRNA-protein transferase